MTALSFTQVEIDGFRGLRSLNLNGLGRVNILVGRNNSGKTSVLEALSILCQPQNPDEWLSMVRRRDFGGLDETIVQSLRWCFTQATVTDYEILIEATCKFKCNGSFPLRELNVKFSEFMETPSRDDSTIEKIMMRGAELVYESVLFNPDLFSEKENTKTLRLLENNYVSKPINTAPSINSKTLTPYSYAINKLQLQLQSKRIFQDDSPSLLELLKDFDTDVEGIDMASFSGNRAAIYIKHRKLGVAPLSVFGDAMRRAVLLAATLPTLKKGGILLIDEVEVGIHVGALANVFRWLVDAARKLEIQIFVTTHSLEALDAIISTNPEQMDDDIVVYQLTQKEEKTHSKRFSGDLLHSLRFDSGLDVR